MERQEPHEIGAALTTAMRALVGLLPLVCATILCGRRLAGGLAGGGRPGALVLTTLVGFALVVAADAAVRLGRRRAAWGWQPLAARLSLTLAAAALVPPFPWQARWWPAVAVAGTGVIAAIGTGLGGVASADHPRRRSRAARHPTDRRAGGGGAATDGRGRPPRPDPAVAAPADESADRAPGDGAGHPDSAMRLAADLPAGAAVSQAIARFRRGDDGADCLQGRLSIALPTGERTGHGHVAFCPPFAVTPRIDLTATADTAEVEATAVEILPWGTRIECRLEQAADEPVAVVVSFTATAGAIPPAL